MTPDEISKQQKELQRMCEQARYGDEPDLQRELIAGQCYWLAEIALQLATANKHLEALAGCASEDGSFSIDGPIGVI